MARKVIPEKVVEAKKQIINSTLELILDQGFSKLTLSKVATKAGITKAAIYWYFTSKDELMLAIVSTLRDDFIGTAQQIAIQPIPLKQKMEAYVLALKEDEIHKNCFLVLKVFLELYSSEDDVKRMIQENYRAYIGILENVFQESRGKNEIRSQLSSHMLARLFIASLDGLVIHDAILGSQIDYEEVLTFFQSMVSETGGQ